MHHSVPSSNKNMVMNFYNKIQVIAYCIHLVLSGFEMFNIQKLDVNR